VRAAVVSLLLAALLAASCESSHPAAPRPAGAACIDRLPLGTLLRVSDGPRRPRPLILALHGARSGSPTAA
jgi:hypothetical protein